MTIQNIMNRKSIRSYNGEPIDDADLAQLLDFIEKTSSTAGIFGNKVNLRYINSGAGGDKLGTYGVIKGARAFVAASTKPAAYNMEDVGYQFEKLILFATSLNLATVCLGGSFSRGDFAEAIGLKDDEVLPIVSPVGYAGDKKSLIGRFIKSNAGNRKPWNELFFDGSIKMPLSALASDMDEFAEVLEAVRQAPSAMNAQPWRILKDGDAAYHFYSAGKNDMNRIDMGIAICHFDIATSEKALVGKFQVLNRDNIDEFKYLVSWVRS